MHKYSKDQIIRQTKNWLERVVVGFNFCPFAKKELLIESIHYSVEESKDPEVCLKSLFLEFLRLDENFKVETTLIIFYNNFGIFDDFLNLVDMCNAFLELQGYEGVYQLATFHPDYCFAESSVNDAANFTNRSPYPTIHIIREASLERVLEQYEDPESIPERNISVAREKGFKVFQTILSDCFKL